MKKVLKIIIICFGFINLHGCSEDTPFEYALPEYRIRNESGQHMSIVIVYEENLSISPSDYELLPLQGNLHKTFLIYFGYDLFEVYEENKVYEGIKGKRDPRDGLNYNYVAPLIYEFVYTTEDYQRFLDSREEE